MIVNKVIEHVNDVRPNTFRVEEKMRWLSDLDGMVRRLVMQDNTPVRYRYPEDMNKELLAKAPFDNIYALYLEAQVDFHNREYDDYNNAIMLFNSMFEEYKKAYIRENLPVSAGHIKNL